MALKASGFRLLLIVGVLLLVCHPGATGAQEKAVLPPPSPGATLLTPEALSKALIEGAGALEKAAGQLKESQTASRGVYEKAAGEIKELKARAATLKASLAVGEVAVSQAQQELQGLNRGQERLLAAIKELSQVQEKAAQERQAKAQARATLQEEMAKLEQSRHPIARAPELRQAYQRYLTLARSYDQEAANFSTHLGKWLQELEGGHRELAEALGQLSAAIDRAWWEKLLTRSTYVSLAQEVWQQLLDTWEALLALPARLTHLLERMVRSGALGGYLKAKAAPLVGLALVFVLTGIFTVRLGRRLLPRFREWQTQAEELGAQVILCFAHLLVAYLPAVGLLAWLTVAVWSLSLWEQPAARLVLLAGTVLLAQRLSRRLLGRVFAGQAAGGILPLDEATARFYRRNLRRLTSYILLLGVFGLNAARLLGFSPGSQELLSYVFQVGLLGWAVWSLRTRSFDTLAQELPLPGWFQRRGVLRAVRSLVLATLVVIILSGLLGFPALSAYVAQAAAGTGLAVVAAWLLWQGLRAGLKFVLHPRRGRLSDRLPMRRETWERYYRTIEISLLDLLLVATVVVALQFWGVKPGHLTRLLEALNYGPALGPVRLTPLTVGSAVLIIYLGRWLSRLLRAFLEVNIFPRLDWDPGVCYTISATSHYAVLILTILLALNTLGFPLANLALVAGALGVGIGFGLQNIVNNFISGLILLFERPIKVGDMLVVDNQWGLVKEIRVRSTVFQTFDKAVLIIPNSELLSSKIVNWTHYGWGPTRLSLKVGVAYGSDVAQVTRLLQEICLSNPRVASEPPPQVFFEAFGDSSLNFHLWVHVHTPGDRIPATHEINSAIFEAFRAHGIEIPFPQRDLHLKSWPAGLPGKQP